MGYTSAVFINLARALFRIFLALFILIPLLEIYLLIQIGTVIGALATILLVLATAIAGAMLLRHQGLFTYARVQQATARGELPTVAMLEGVVLMFAGVMLLTPGFFTDALGFLALIPPLRRAMILKILERGVIVGQAGPPPRGPEPGQRTIEGDYRREE